MDAITVLALTLGVAILIGYFLTNFISRRKQSGGEESSIENVPVDQQPKQSKKSQQKAGTQPRTRKQSEFSHPCSATVLKVIMLLTRIFSQ